ncbi:AraC-type DNA-binding protein [Caldanaerobius fijiensis DSM 17918]|uniref:AraC-type DNA-binding protein n=1 Tax=Caldanaerobius fijiensis DSM 17918 TaxID=1121256 RepID=A0A1M5CSH8_9THEO|nr:helix-turn-helix domain-containing protein [Caldanaerobius fijiensis]SHF57636.1 AraC-type DNA-binding protein [Caldanaerobius fijiensis DSM 17918]
MARKVTTFYRIFFSYLIILIIPISIIGTINYIRISNIVENTVKRESLTMLRQAADIIDVRAKELDKLSFELSSNPRIRNFLYETGPIDVNTRLLIIDIIRDLAIYRAPNGFIDDIFIYSKKNGMVVSSSGMYTLDMFYDVMYKYKDASYEEWKYLLDQYHYRYYVPSKIVTNDNKTSKEVTYLQTLPQDETNVIGTLIIFIDDDQYSSIMSKLVKDSRGYYYILDSNGDVITTNDKKELYLKMVKNNRSTQDDFQSIKYDNNTLVVSHVTSAYNKWRYITIIPLDIFMGQVKGVKKFTIGLVLTCIVIGLIISYYVANKNYKPLKEILSYINRDRLSVLYDDKYDDYKVIYNVIRKSYNEIAAYEEEIKKYKPVFKQDLLMRLLNGSILDVPLEELSKNIDIDLDFDLFAVILIHIDFKKGYSHSTEVEMGLFRLTAMKSIEDIIKRIGAGYLLELNGGLIAIIFTRNGNIEMCRKDLLSLSNEIKEYLEAKLRLKINIGIGKIYSDYKDIARSYEEAKEALDYAVMRENDILFYENIDVENDIYDFTIQKEIQLANCIKAGDEARAVQIIDELYRENICERHLSLGMMKYFVYDVYSTTLKIAHEIEISGICDIFKEHRNFLMFNSIRASIEEIKALVRSICHIVNEHKKRNNRLIEDIVNFIDNNYTNKEISLDMVAEQFDISSQYLSRFFKEHMGFNYIDYLNKKRIEKAKELLLNSNMKIKEIACKTGFDNANTFIKVFRKYEGITPGQFRAN